MRLPPMGSTLVIVVLAIILVSISGLEINQWRKRHQIQLEIDHITQQQSDYQQKNQDLENSLNLLNTKNYKEKIAREQLSLKKDGEIVVNFPPPAPADNQSKTAEGQTNPQKWWHYFFGNN